MAILKESNTGLGMAILQKSNTESFDILSLPFPLHIAEVETAMLKSQQNKELSMPQLRTTRLKISLPQDGTHGINTEPSMDPAMTAAVAEQVLSHILATIARENITYVGIVSTDTRDKIFLANLIHEYCADVQLFTTEGDQLLASPDYFSYTKGMIVGTSYPLFLDNQKWSFPFKGKDQHRLSFDMESTFGTYNAAVLLLQDDKDNYSGDVLLEYGMPIPTPMPKPMYKRRPPVWITVVGRNGMWPIEAHDSMGLSKEYQDSLGLHDHDCYTFSLQNVVKNPLPELHPAAPLSLLWFSTGLVACIVCALLVHDFARRNPQPRSILAPVDRSRRKQASTDCARAPARARGPCRAGGASRPCCACGPARARGPCRPCCAHRPARARGPCRSRRIRLFRSDRLFFPFLPRRPGPALLLHRQAEFAGVAECDPAEHNRAMFCLVLVFAADLRGCHLANLWPVPA